MKKTDGYERLRKRYEEGEVPWDERLPPPEVQEAAAERAPGRALDLGCGYGRAAIYLAQRGWTVDGVDFIDLALEEAARRAEAAGVSVTFYQGSVTDLSFLQGPYDLALDVGCGHSLDESGLAAYHMQLKRLLAPGALFLFFARLRNAAVGEAEEEAWGLDEPLFRRIFEEGFDLYRYEPGVTEMTEDNSHWSSAWFWLRRVVD